MGRRNQKGRKGGKREWKRARWRPGSARGLTQTIGQPKAKPRSTGTGRLPPFLLLLPVPSVASLPSRCCASVNDKKINKPAVGAEDPKDAAPEWSRCCADFPTGKMGPGIGTSLGYFPWVALGPCLFCFCLSAVRASLATCPQASFLLFSCGTSRGGEGGKKGMETSEVAARLCARADPDHRPAKG